MVKGFKDFLLRGNVVDLAVAVALGAAFTALVAQFGKTVIEPIVKLVGGGGVQGGTFTVDGVIFDVGALVNSLIVFVVTAAAIYVLVVAPVNALMERRKRGEESEVAAPSEDIVLLQEIRDLLRERAG